MNKLTKILFAFAFVAILSGCGGGGGNKNTTNSQGVSTTPHKEQKNIISGYVIDDAVKGATVYILFEDGTKSTQATTKSDGSYELKLSDDDLSKINPVIPDGADGPKDDLILVAEKDGKILRNAIDRDVENGKIVYITNDTEAYAEYLEAIGEFTASALTSFNNELEKGRIKDSSDLSDLIKDIRADVKSYFYGGDKPTASSIFEKALTHLGKEKLAQMSDHSSYVVHRNVMSGGDIILPSNVTVESDDITLTAKGNGRFTVGDGSDGDITAYLKISDNGVYRLIPISIKEKQTTLLSSSVVTPQKGEKIGTDTDSISATIPPYALLTNKTISFSKIESQGETADGKMILDMQPSGLKFDLPITVKIKYSDFGVTDPEAVEWKYGSVDGGYEDADIVNIDKENGVIYLNVNHFSNLVVREIKSQKYLDLKHNFVLQVPRRNKYLQPSDATQDKEFYSLSNKIISNRLFEGASTSSRVGFSISGGHCVQFDGAFYYPLTIGKAIQLSTAHNVYMYFWKKQQYTITYNKKKKEILTKKTPQLPKGVRKSSGECKYGDYVAVNSGYGTGHTGVFKSYNIKTHKLILIQENATATNLNLSKTYKKTGYFHKRFGIGETFQKSFSTYYGVEKSLLIKPKYFKKRAIGKNNRFICINPSDLEYQSTTLTKRIYNDKGNDFKTILDNEAIKGTFNTTNGELVTEKPWLYYLLNRKNDGVYITYESKSKARYYKYDPDVLPVAPLKLDSNYKLTSDVESRYEIYVTNNFNNDFRLTGFTTPQPKELKSEKNIKKTNKSLIFNGNTLYKLKQKDTNITEFKLIPKNGVESFESRYELRTATEDKTVDTKKKVLFSPNIIDDYYVNWSKDNKYDTSKILIGFWNKYGYDIPLADNDGEITNPLKPKKIYKSFNAVNGYFMTLADGDSAEWHFSLAGVHAIFVHVPTGKYSDIEKAKYQYKDIKGEVHTLKAKRISEKLKDSGFENWFVLYEEKDDKKHYGFNLRGSESVKVTAKGGTVVVDALRLQGRTSLVEDLVTLKGTVSLSDKDDIKH